MAASRQPRLCLRRTLTSTAIFCENDSMCLGAQKVIEDQGLQDQVFVAGVDGQVGSPRGDHAGRRLQVYRA